MRQAKTAKFDRFSEVDISSLSSVTTYRSSSADTSCSEYNIGWKTVLVSIMEDMLIKADTIVNSEVIPVASLSVTTWWSFRWHIFSGSLYWARSPAWYGYRYFGLHLRHVVVHLARDCIFASLGVSNTIVQICSSFISINFVIVGETTYIKFLFWQCHSLILLLQKVVQQLEYAMFINNNRTSFYLWWKENLVKHQKNLKILWKWLWVSNLWTFYLKRC